MSYHSTLSIEKITYFKNCNKMLINKTSNIIYFTDFLSGWKLLNNALKYNSILDSTIVFWLCKKWSFYLFPFFHIKRKSMSFMQLFDFRFLIDLHVLGCPENDLTTFGKCLSVCLSVCVSVCVTVCGSVCVSLCMTKTLWQV